MNAVAVAVQGLLAFFLPLLVRIVSQWGTTSFVKGMILAALSLLLGILVDWQTNPHLNLVWAFVYALEAWVVAVATHFGAWKPAQETANLRRAARGSGRG